MNDTEHTTEDQPRFGGHPVIDAQGSHVGTITDVVFDVRTEAPKWGVVNPGVLRASHYVPLMPPTYVSQDGNVVVPYDKITILRAPKATREHLVSPMLERELEHHYALAE